MIVEIVLLGFLVALFYVLLNPRKDFWKAYGVRQIETSTPYGVLRTILGKKSVADFDKVAYEEMKRTGEKFLGVVEVGVPIVLLSDLDIVKKVLIKDFDYFMDRRPLGYSKSQKMSGKMLGNMVAEDGWKDMRTQLTPTFTTGKIRRMMEFFNEMGVDWVDRLKGDIAKNGGAPVALKIKPEIAHFTADVIALAVLGIKADVTRNADSYFSKMVHKFGDLGLVPNMRFMLSAYFPNLWSISGFHAFNQDAVDFFSKIFEEGLKVRKESKIKGNDFIQLLVEASKGELKPDSEEISEFEKYVEQKKATDKNYVSSETIASAQALLFFFAGFNTISIVISFLLYELAVNPKVQKKLRDEIDEKLFPKGDEKSVDYDAVNELAYLDMVVAEILRKHPPLVRVERICVRDYHDPETNLRIPKGAVVGIPARAIQRDTEHYEYPDEFYPEHFSAENKAKRNTYSYLSFGSGPRNCIGMRFALVEIKAVIAHIVHNFLVEPTAKTPIPVQTTESVLIQPPDNLELKFSLAK